MIIIINSFRSLELSVDAHVDVAGCESCERCENCDVLEHDDLLRTRVELWRVVVIIGDLDLDVRHVDVTHVGVAHVDGEVEERPIELLKVNRLGQTRLC